MASQAEWVKWVPGTRFMVDGFAFANPKCSHYFLTHCHSDHTVGLKRSFTGTIYCSEVSARLLAYEWKLHAPQVVVLQLDHPVVIAGVTVTAIDANHCPGAIMLLFEVPEATGSGLTRILHTGDCRWQDELHANSCLAHKRVDTLMLDTTYALPRYTFPAQQVAINSMVQAIQSELAEEPDCLFVVGSYHIGKERAYLGAAEALGWKVYAPPAKRKVLQLVLPTHQLHLLTDDAAAAQLHVAPMATPDPAKLAAAYLDKEHGRPWKRVVAFRPAGWSYNRSGKLSVWRGERAAVYGIPYSEHSSWHDLRACVKALRPKKIIPTVNATSRAAAAAIVERFVDLMDLSSSRGRIDIFLTRSSDQPAARTLAAAAGVSVVVPGTPAGSSLQQEQSNPCCCPMSSGGPAADCSTVVGSWCSNCSPGNAWNQGGKGSMSEDVHAETGAAAASIEAAGTQSTAVGGSQQGSHNGTIESAFAALDGLYSRADVGSSAGTGPLQLQGGSISDIVVQDELQLELSSVDLAQQQRLLDEAQRRLRLKHSLSLVAAKGTGNRSSCQKTNPKRRRAK